MGRASTRSGVVAVVAVIVAVSAASLASASTADAGSDPRPPVLVVAHRGFSADAPEHTGAAYDRAVWAGTDVLECDLQLTADRQLVCLHDPTVDRTTGGTATGAVDSFTLAQLRAMDFGSWFGAEFAGAHVVTLDEQLSCYHAADPTLQFYIETKTQPDQGTEMETQLVDVLRAHDLIPAGPPDVRTSPVIIQSFDADSLATVRSLAPSLPTAQLLAATTPEIDAGQLPNVDVLAPSDDVLAAHPDLVTGAHAAGMEVHTWTVDDPAAMRSLVDQGIDGFFTNDTATGRAVVDAAGRGTGRGPIDPGDPPRVSTVEACPVGAGLGLTVAASTDTTADVATAPDVAPTETSNAPWMFMVLGAAVVAGAGLLLASRARRPGANR